MAVCIEGHGVGDAGVYQSQIVTVDSHFIIAVVTGELGFVIRTINRKFAGAALHLYADGSCNGQFTGHIDEPVGIKGNIKHAAVYLRIAAKVKRAKAVDGASISTAADRAAADGHGAGGALVEDAVSFAGNRAVHDARGALALLFNINAVSETGFRAAGDRAAIHIECAVCHVHTDAFITDDLTICTVGQGKARTLANLEVMIIHIHRDGMTVQAKRNLAFGSIPCSRKGHIIGQIISTGLSGQGGSAGPLCNRLMRIAVDVAAASVASVYIVTGTGRQCRCRQQAEEHHNAQQKAQYAFLHRFFSSINIICMNLN